MGPFPRGERVAPQAVVVESRLGFRIDPPVSIEGLGVQFGAWG